MIPLLLPLVVTTLEPLPELAVGNVAVCGLNGTVGLTLEVAFVIPE
jgi:hypothetical protein